MEGNEDNTKKGLEGTGLELPVNRHGNLKSASTDQNLTDILHHIKSSKTPVTHPPCLFPLLAFLKLNHLLHLLIIVSLILRLQAVINYGASWYVSGFTNNKTITGYVVRIIYAHKVFDEKLIYNFSFSSQSVNISQEMPISFGICLWFDFF